VVHFMPSCHLLQPLPKSRPRTIPAGGQGRPARLLA
jgi:hypothetical protein